MSLTEFTFYMISMVAAFTAMYLSIRETLRDLMMLQQNSYRNERYMRWLRESGDTTSMSRLCAMGIFLVSLVWFTPDWVAAVFIILFSSLRGGELARRRYKKPLVFTRRATRIFLTATIPPLLVAAALMWFNRHNFDIWYVMAVAYLGFYCISHMIILAANKALEPVERHINGKYYRDAASRLRSMPDLRVVGVTGSYGKTSTKHYLERILSEQFQVRMTPGSYNTTLGVIRTVREYLKPYDEIFIVEMGAKQRGDIKEICDLVHPSIGIVTAVGEQHLESFGSVENVRDTKFELVDALPADGLAVVNDDFPMIASREVDNVECVRYAVENSANAAYSAKEIRYSRQGTDFTVCCPDGSEIALHTRLVGECNISNLLAAVIVALRLGMSPDKIRYAVEQIEPVEHRLSMKRTPGGVTIIDDAFNSNPHGSKMAMDVLAMMTPGKRIVVTPGMIELGERQEELNAALGEHIARSADVAVIVGEYNRGALLEGIRRAGHGGIEASAVHPVDTFNDAQKLLQSILAPGDTVLYENDLPDTFK